MDAACEREGRDRPTLSRSTQALTGVTDSAESEATAADDALAEALAPLA